MSRDPEARALLLMMALASAVIPAPSLAQAAARGPVIAAGAIAEPLTAIPGDAGRGRGIALDRDLGNCTLCHVLPDLPATMRAGNVGPPLAGVGARLDAGRLRLRLVDSTRINPESAMPAYYRSANLVQVAAPYRGRPVLTAQQIEDVIAYLGSLR